MLDLQSFGQEESKKYYESELQKKILYIPNLSYFLNMINQQTLKLPHEVQDPNNPQPIGTTYEDIEKSIINSIEAVWAQLAPLRRKLSNEPDKLLQWKDGRPEDFGAAMKKLEMVYLLLDKADALNENLITEDMDLEEEYDDDLEVEDELERKMPAPIQQAHAEALGKVEGKNP